MKRIIPPFVINIYRLFFDFKQVLSFSYYDLKRFVKYSSAISNDYENEDSLLSSIIMDYHRIEKGLSLVNMRPKFGLYFIPDLINRIIFYDKNYGKHEMIEAAINSLSTYSIRHQDLNEDIGELKFKISSIEEKIKPKYASFSSVKNISYENLKQISNNFNFEAFVKSRHSIREYEDKVVDDLTIEKAIDFAKFTPSVCNRQPWRVYNVKGEKLNAILDLQNGNSTFRNQIKNVFVVVGKLSRMRMPIERHQSYIDGGMFSMSLIYSLHSLGLASCPLNWCVKPQNDLKMRKILELKNDEEIMMLLSFGYMKKKFQVPSSPRFQSSNLLSTVK